MLLRVCVCETCTLPVPTFAVLKFNVTLQCLQICTPTLPYTFAYFLSREYLTLWCCKRCFRKLFHKGSANLTQGGAYV